MLSEDEISHKAASAALIFEGSAPWQRVLNELPLLDVYLAGGCLRDVLRGRVSGYHDLDFFIGGSAVEEALARLAHVGRWSQGPFGSPRWHPLPGEPLHCDVVPIKAFNNGLWPCEDILDVLNQFDFTVNAVAVSIRTREIFDPQNGRRDLARGIMRAVRFDYPDQPIAPGQSLTRLTVLWFRLLHYAAALDLSIEPVTLQWLQRHRHFSAQAEVFSSTFFPLHRRALEPVGIPSNLHIS
jgi:hypothetical protein